MVLKSVTCNVRIMPSGGLGESLVSLGGVVAGGICNSNASAGDFSGHFWIITAAVEESILAVAVASFGFG